MKHATGTFNVKITPQKVDNAEAQTAGVGRNSIQKEFEGAIVGAGHAEMLWSGAPPTSGAYVALEKVTGSVHGRPGSFMLMHSAVMYRGTPDDWVVRVIPDSGTGELTGISGTLTIQIADGKHSYDFAYTLPGEGR